MMTDRLDGILRQALTPEEEPAEALNQRILRRIKEEEQTMENTEKVIVWKTDGREAGRSGRRRVPAAAIAAALMLSVASVSALAAARLLGPAQVTEIVGDEKLTAVFAGEGGIYVGETQSYGGYDVTFLGIASGKNISDGVFYENGKLREDRSYTVVAIANSDGTPVPDASSGEYDISDFLVTPLIRGCDPAWYNVYTLGGGAAAETVLDGVRYRVTECDNVEMFADRELYLGVMDSMTYNSAAYVYDAESGEIRRNESYTGLNALFSLPIDQAKADPEAAGEYLEKLQKELFPDSADVETADAAAEGTLGDAEYEQQIDYEAQMREILGDDFEEWKAVEDWFRTLTPENLDEYAVPVESTRKVLKTDADGYFSGGNYAIEGRSGAEGGRYLADWFFQKSSRVMQLSHSGSMDSVVISVFTLNEDGTVTFVAYIPK